MTPRQIVILLFGIFCVSIAGNFVYDHLVLTEEGSESWLAEDSYSDYSCNTIGIDLRGGIYTYTTETEETEDEEYSEPMVSSEDVVTDIRMANEDPDIEAILITVDSGGGYPVAGEEIAEAVRASEKPVVAVIRSIGASAAYWAVSPADRIFASRNSDVGSIGVTMSYLDNVEKNEKEGYSYVELSSGKFKDSGTPDKKLTPEEKALFERDIEILHENLISDIAENRNLDIEKVRELADGSTMLGGAAKEKGLIDEIGTYMDAERYIETLIGKKAEVCVY